MVSCSPTQRFGQVWLPDPIASCTSKRHAFTSDTHPKRSRLLGFLTFLSALQPFSREPMCSNNSSRLHAGERSYPLMLPYFVVSSSGSEDEKQSTGCTVYESTVHLYHSFGPYPIKLFDPYTSSLGLFDTSSNLSSSPPLFHFISDLYPHLNKRGTLISPFPSRLSVPTQI